MSFIKPSFNMLNVNMLSVIMLSAFMLSIVALWIQLYLNGCITLFVHKIFYKCAKRSTVKFDKTGTFSNEWKRLGLNVVGMEWYLKNFLLSLSSEWYLIYRKLEITSMIRYPKTKEWATMSLKNISPRTISTLHFLQIQRMVPIS